MFYLIFIAIFLVVGFCFYGWVVRVLGWMVPALLNDLKNSVGQWIQGKPARHTWVNINDYGVYIEKQRGLDSYRRR